MKEKVSSPCYNPEFNNCGCMGGFKGFDAFENDGFSNFEALGFRNTSGSGGLIGSGVGVAGYDFGKRPPGRTADPNKTTAPPPPTTYPAFKPWHGLVLAGILLGVAVVFKITRGNASASSSPIITT